jgi:hypothetical protein
MISINWLGLSRGGRGHGDSVAATMDASRRHPIAGSLTMFPSLSFNFAGPLWLRPCVNHQTLLIDWVPGSRKRRTRLGPLCFTSSIPFLICVGTSRLQRALETCQGDFPQGCDARHCRGTRRILGSGRSAGSCRRRWRRGCLGVHTILWGRQPLHYPPPLQTHHQVTKMAAGGRRFLSSRTSTVSISGWSRRRRRSTSLHTSSLFTSATSQRPGLRHRLLRGQDPPPCSPRSYTLWRTAWRAKLALETSLDSALMPSLEPMLQQDRVLWRRTRWG